MRRRTMLMAAMLCLVLSITSVHADGSIPDTGQTASYTDTFGEDSDYLINPPSFTKLGYGGVELDDSVTQADGWIMTRDNVTGFIWEIKTDDGSNHDKDNTYRWCDSDPKTNGGDSGPCDLSADTEDFIKGLNGENFGGFSDWRLPTRKELIAIMDYGANNPVIDSDFFPNAKTDSRYWSSTTRAYVTSQAWETSFGQGYSGYSDKYYAYHVRAVRSEQPDSENDLSALIDNGDGTITDTVTGLMWQQTSSASNPFHSWEDALTYCENLVFPELDGYDDWRLPTIKELDSIVDLTRVFPALDLLFDQRWGSWSSTTSAYNTECAWEMYFGEGDINYSSAKYSTKGAFAVRGGHFQSSGHLIVTDPKQGDIWAQGESKTISWNTQSIPGNVRIALSRDGGRTFSEILSESIPNSGTFEWMATGPAGCNIVLKIIPLSDPDKATTQGLFTIDMDTDNDGLSDIVEDPNRNGVVDPGETDPCDWDSDDDDMSDGYEVDNNLDPFVDDATGDRDGDGFSNIREYVAGTSADDIDDKPSFQAETEDFETGDFSKYAWLTSGSALWLVTENNAYNSTYSAEAAAITDNQITSLEISRYTEAGDFSFWYAVDSEQSHDWLYFYLDGSLASEWSGSVPYSKAIFPLDSGMHHFRWEYVKDNSDLGGADTTWIDDVTFPGFVDSDGDGMPDGWEIDYDLDALIEDAGDDADDDLFTNGMECLMGTDPRNSSDYPVMSNGFDADMDVDGADLSRMAEGVANGVVTPEEVQTFAEEFGR